MDLIIIHQKVSVPTRSPFEFARLEINIISEDNIRISSYFLRSMSARRNFGIWVACQQSRILIIPLFVFMMHAVGNNLKTNYTSIL